jgi:archaemetzincin
MLQYIHHITLYLLLPVVLFAQPSITIALQPFETFPQKYREEIKTGINTIYGEVTIIVLPEKKLPDSAYYKPRNRYRAEKLLDYLDSIKAKEHTKTVGLTIKDISTTKGKYYDWGIFGLGTINGSACVVSTFRLKKKNESEKLMIQRLIKVVNHELGHTFGLMHCPHKGCLMEDAKGTIKTVDNSNGNFCNDCKKLLEIVLPLPKDKPE